jgi:hypothetical protein
MKCRSNLLHHEDYCYLGENSDVVRLMLADVAKGTLDNITMQVMEAARSSEMSVCLY